MKVVDRNINDLIPAEYNPRYISEEQLSHLKASIQRFDAVEPVLVNMHPERKNIIISGHQRIKAAQSLGIEEFPCVELNLDKEKERELNIRMNKNTGSWDWDGLANYFDVEELTDWGFTEDELFGNFETEELEAEEDDYEIPEEIETDFALGDLIEIGEHRLLCGDSTDSDQVAKLMDGQKADMVFTSPPYNSNLSGTPHKGAKTKGFYKGGYSDNKTSEEYIQFNQDVFTTIKTIASENLVLLYNINYNRNSPSEYIDIIKNAKDVFSLVETIIWEKQMSVSLVGDNLTRIYEFIFVFFNGADKPSINKEHSECVKNLWKVSNVGANTEKHSACFPVELVSKAINLYSDTNKLVYDPFLGSGSTMVACHQLNRKCYGMELDPKYCQVIVDRMLKLDPSLEIKVNNEIYKGTPEPV